ncbi:MAG: GntR family transcriptional regulator [Pseudomonadales bacterium]
MKIVWNEQEPIYVQLYQYLARLIVEQVIEEGAPLPSVREIASEQRVNPITVSRAIQLLVDDKIVEKRRGLGMFVTTGAAATLKAQLRKKFLRSEWPSIRRRIDLLGLSVEQLLKDSDP